MHVDVTGNAGAGRFAQVHAQIQAVGMVDIAQHSFQLLRECHHFLGGRSSQSLKLVNVLVRSNHDVTGGVGKGIEHHKTVLPAMDNQRFFVVIAVGLDAKDAF